MSTAKEFIEKFDKMDVSEKMTYESLLLMFKGIEEKRLSYDKASTLLKKKESFLRQTMINKLLAEKQESAKTSVGTVYTYVKQHLVTKESKELASWFRGSIIYEFMVYFRGNDLTLGKKLDNAYDKYLAQESFLDNTDLLLATPYSKPKMIDFIGDDDPPPGVTWDSEQKLGIRKK